MYVQTKYDSTIPFTTNIIFLSPRGMARVAKKIRKSPNYMQIDDWYVRPPKDDITLQGYRTNCSLGYTYGIRSCSFGVSVKKGADAPYFWHIKDTKANVKDLQDIRNLTNCDNVILLGSKSEFFYSRKLFNKFESFIKKDKVQASIMKGLSLKWQAFAAYVSKNDTLFLCIQEMYKKFPKRVNSMKKLKKIFEKIKISPTDNLQFPNFLQEYLLIKKLKIQD